MSSKSCKRCGEDKPLDLFFNDLKAKDGKRASCKQCVLARRNRPKEVLPLNHKRCSGCGEIKPYDNFWLDSSNKTDGRYSHCTVCKTKSTYAWRELNKDKYNETMRAHNKKRYPVDRLRRYGLTPEQHAQMLADQKGVCAICNNPPKGKRPLCVDHRHADGKVRGLLCYGCNRALHILETKELLVAAVAYLDGYK